jgi:hypothetical protein
MLADALLLCKKQLLSDGNTKLSSKRFLFISHSVKLCGNPCVGENILLKKEGWKKILLELQKKILS